MLSVVENVALNGKMLITSAEYQQLRQKGFFITSLTWISQQEYSPFNMWEFDAGIEDAREGKGFRYNVRGFYRKGKKAFTKTRIAVDDDEKQPLFPLIERTARQILSQLKKSPDSPDKSVGAVAQS